MDTWPTPFAASIGPAGGVIHRISKVGQYAGGRPGLVTQCGTAIGLNSEAVDVVCSGDARCRRCDIDGLQVAPSVVYFARTAFCGIPTLKLGQSKRLVARMWDLDAELVFQVPGTTREERSLLEALRQVASPVGGREWFPDTAEVLAAAEQWFTAQRTEEAA